MPNELEIPSLPEAPSAAFIQAISAFLDTDPSDLLVELGYYDRAETPSEK